MDELEKSSQAATHAHKKPRNRRSRGKGLRAKTGCITCRRRHMKCSEERPICSQCHKSHRQCSWEVASAPPTSSRSASGTVTGTEEEEEDIDTSVPMAQVYHEQPANDNGYASPVNNASISIEPDNQDDDLYPSTRAEQLLNAVIEPQQQQQQLSSNLAEATIDHVLQELDNQEFVLSPANSDMLSLNTVSSTQNLPPNLASFRWLGLLAADAAQADPSFSLTPFTIPPARVHPGIALPACHSSPSHSFSPALNQVQEHLLYEGSQSALQNNTNRPHRDSIQLDRARNLSFSDDQFRRPSVPPTSRDEKSLWQSQEVIQLSNHEVTIFRNFVEKVSLWIDLFDPYKHFSTYVPRLALYNEGLMKAILALSARHLSLDSANATLPLQERNFAVQYYFETLHYLRNAMQYESYIRSPELLSTVLVVSSYEMIDGSNSGWERHLKGVFWIQRSQDINGDSEGIKRAVWWAWLRQDAWASFRERRRMLSFWKPTRPYSALNRHELANRSVYLLAQCVNYSSDEEVEAGKRNLQVRIDRGGQLLKMLSEWRESLGEDFEPLSSTPDECGDITAQWFHPPQFGVALQIYSFATILVILHRPSGGGYKDYQTSQKTLSECVNTICGIAMTSTDDACSLISCQCLFCAGLAVVDPKKRQLIADLIDGCQRRTGWPITSLSDIVLAGGRFLHVAEKIFAFMGCQIGSKTNGSDVCA